MEDKLPRLEWVRQPDLLVPETSAQEHEFTNPVAWHFLLSEQLTIPLGGGARSEPRWMPVRWMSFVPYPQTRAGAVATMLKQMAISRALAVRVYQVRPPPGVANGGMGDGANG